MEKIVYVTNSTLLPTTTHIDCPLVAVMEKWAEGGESPFTASKAFSACSFLTAVDPWRPWICDDFLVGVKCSYTSEK